MRTEDGMTLIEVMVAMAILLVGVLGVFSMLDTGNEVTRHNLAREAATSLAREEIELARQVLHNAAEAAAVPDPAIVTDPAHVADPAVDLLTPGNATLLDLTKMVYADLADPRKIAGGLAGAVKGSNPPPSNESTSFVTWRRGFAYTTTIASCVIDDPSDGVGGAPGTPCAPLPPASGGGGTAPGGSGSTTLNLNILGIPITGGGQIIEAVCSLIGRNSVLDGLLGGGGLLGGLVSSGADTGLCSSGTRQVAYDRQPADALRVTARVTWTKPTAGKVVQHTVIAGPQVTQ
jgi:prepilin-type N-terminal cleavage/methylation domain-containing protein